MAFDGAGNYSRTNGVNTGTTVWASDAAASTNILSTRHDTHDQDLATALSLCLCKDGQSTPTANLTIGGFKLTSLGAGTAANDAVRVTNAQVATYTWGGTSGGSANAHTVSLSPALAVYTTGERFAFLAGFTNTSTAVTLNINSVGAKNLTKGDNIVLSEGDIVLNTIVEVCYDGTEFLLLNPRTIPLTNATAAAAGSNQGNATSINNVMTVVSGADATKGVIVTAAGVGKMMFVVNQAAAILKVYPPSGSSFGAHASNANVSMAADSCAIFYQVSGSQWGALLGAAT